MKEPTISLIIPAYNEEKYIGACLEYAIKNSGGRFHEIIVVDNASTDRTREVAEKYPGVRVIHEDRKGVMWARQRGFEESQGDVLAYIDADTRMGEGWIEKMMHIFSTEPKVVCLSGPYKYYDGLQWKNKIMHFLWWLSAPIAYHITGYAVLGGNFVVKRQALISVGGFNTSIDFYGDDTDVARRLHKVGKVIFRMDFFIYSSSRRFNEEGLIRTNFNYVINFIWMALFHKPFTKKYTDVRFTKS